MASVRFTDMQFRLVEFLDFTSLTLDEFQQLVPPFEAAFQAHMAAWRLDGKREHGDAGDQAASGNSSTSISGYHRLNTVPSSRLSVLTRVCNSKCAPRLLHCIYCFLQKRLLTTWFTVDSTNPVAMASPFRYRSP